MGYALCIFATLFSVLCLLLVLIDLENNSGSTPQCRIQAANICPASAAPLVDLLGKPYCAEAGLITLGRLSACRNVPSHPLQPPVYSTGETVPSRVSGGHHRK